MDFDPESAVLDVPDQKEQAPVATGGGFDPSSAEPVVDSHETADKSFKAQWSEAQTPLERLKVIGDYFSNPWAKYKQSVEQSFDRPKVLKEIPAIEVDSKANDAAQVGAAVVNTGTGLVNAMQSSGGASLALNPAAMVYASPYFASKTWDDAKETFHDFAKAIEGKEEVGAGKLAKGVLDTALGFLATTAGTMHGVKETARIAKDPLTVDGPVTAPDAMSEPLRTEGAQPKANTAVSEPVSAPPTPEVTPSTPFDAESAKPVQETVASAAVKLADGEVVTGKTHGQIAADLGERDLTGADDGFVTSTGRYVTREEGMKLAKETGQVEEGNLGPDRLHAEHLDEGQSRPPIKTEPAPAVDAVVKSVKEVADMGNEAFQKFADAQEDGGYTKRAIELGISAIDKPEALAEIKKAQETNTAEFEKAMAAEDLDAASILASKQQFFREALEAAENKGSAMKEPEVQAAHAAFDEASAKPEVPGFVTSVKNAQVDAERAARGLEPIMKVAKLENGVAWDQAMAAIEADPALPARLTEEMTTAPRALNPIENAVLVHDRITKRKEFRDAAQAVVEANEAGNAVDIAQAEKRYEAASDAMQKIDLMEDRVGTESGRSLQARKMMASEDYSLETLTLEKRAAKGGEALTPAEVKEVQDTADAIKSKQQELDEATAATEAPASATESSPSVVKNITQRILATLDKQAEASAKRLRGKLFTISPAVIYDMSVIAARDIAHGTVDLASWTKRMVDEFGEKVIPHLETAWEKGSAMLDTQLEKVGGKKRTNSAGLRSIEAQKTKLEKAIAEKEHKIETGDLSPDPRPVNRPADPALETLKQRRDELNDAIDKLRRKPAAPKPAPKTPEQRTESRLRGQVETLKQRIEEGDYAPREKKPIHLNPEINELRAELDKLKNDFRVGLENDRYAKLSKIGKAKVQTANTYDAARNLMTTGEFSFVLRQGKLTALSHPLLTARALPNAFKALFADEVGARALDLEVMNHPEAPIAKAAKLHLVEEGARLSKQEEAFVSRWIEKIPEFKGMSTGKKILSAPFKLAQKFNQAGRVFLNKIRFDLFRSIRDSMGSDANPVRDRQLAQFINESTGRGGLGSLEPAAVPLGRLLFSPRFLASRIQIATGHSLWGGDFATRRAIGKEYAKILIGLSAYYTSLMLALGDDKKKPTVTFDPRSSDFGKVKVGKTRLDPLAGLAQTIVFGSRTGLAAYNAIARETGAKQIPEKVNLKEQSSFISGPKVPFKGDRWTDVAFNFARSKLHPIPGTVANLFNGTDLAGKEADIESQGLNFVTPLTYVDIYQGLKENDLEDGVALSLLALLGEGLQTYENGQKKQKH